MNQIRKRGDRNRKQGNALVFWLLLFLLGLMIPIVSLTLWKVGG